MPPKTTILYKSPDLVGSNEIGRMITRGLSICKLVLSCCLLISGFLILSVILLCSMEAQFYWYAGGIVVGFLCCLVAVLGVVASALKGSKTCVNVTYFLFDLVCISIAICLSAVSVFWMHEVWVQIGRGEQCGQCNTWDPTITLMIGLSLQIISLAAYDASVKYAGMKRDKYSFACIGHIQHVCKSYYL
uniref:Uncharacterized protein n=1 Tax=Romanomermis culicivorax TaxID=13658 RepID=A0A915I9C2_ROMCU